MEKTKITIIKVGGKMLDSEKELDKLLSGFASIKGKKLLVHGGGVFINELCTKLNIETQMVDGRRITSAENMDVVLMACAGKLNKNLVAGLNKKGMQAVGLCGGDLGILSSKKRNPKPINFDQVGDISKVDTKWLSVFMENGVVPVISSISQSDEYELLNTNADTVAAHLANALSANYEVKLFFYFDKVGVLQNVNDDATLIPSLSIEDVAELKSKNAIHKGMLPKLQNGFYALQNGAAEVKLGNNFKKGTQLSM